jgi:hypothetical protein
LLWQQAHLRTPEQVERWSWIVACACNQLLLCQQSGRARLASVGKQTASGHPAAGASGDAQDFAAAWHTAFAAQTTWKIARLAQRQAKDTGTTLCVGQKTPTCAKNSSETGVSASPLVS